MLLNYLLECHISMTFQKIQKNFRSLCTLVIKIHESCCSIFNELCFFAASPCGSQLIYYTTLSFVCQEVFQTFFKFFSPSRLPPTLRCRSLAAPIVYHILPRLSTPFCKFFQDFSIFSAIALQTHDRNAFPHPDSFEIPFSAAPIPSYGMPSTNILIK